MSVPLVRRHRTAFGALAVGTAAVVALTACSSSSGGSTPADTATSTAAAAAGSTGASSSAAAAGSLAGVCPSTIKIQTGWYPEAEKGALYQIVGANGKVDKNSGSFSGTVDGVTVSILAGGPYLGNQSTVAKMYQDSSVLLGEVSTDDAIELSGSRTPVVAVVAPMQKSPKAVIFDPTKYKFTKVSDVAGSGATVLKSGEDASTDILVANNSLKKSQMDYSYDGSPGRFVTSGGKDVIVDYATNVPYNYENTITQWKKPLSSLLLADAGYTAYENSLSVTPANLTKYSACLKAFVPIVQKAIVAYTADPTPVDNAMITYATSVKSPTTLSTGLNTYANKVMKDDGILANGTDGVAGSMDTDRVTKLISSMNAISKQLNVKIKSGLQASDIVTDQFLDTSVTIGS